MRRIDTASAVADLHGPGKAGFRDGNPQIGAAPTAFNAAWPNALQEEIAQAVELSGLELNSDDNTQLYQAIVKTMTNKSITTFLIDEPLPEINIGPIWHEKYASVMEWVVFNLNGAKYTGYASVGIGRIPTETQPTLRTGYIRSGAASYNQTTYPALWNWAKHNGLVKSVVQWSQGTIFYRDNADGTFTPPDVRGEFQRYFDDGRGVDVGRGFGSWQAASATGGYSIGQQNSAVYTSVIGFDGTVPNPDGYVYITPDKVKANGAQLDRYFLRPRSTAFLAAIKH